MTRSIIILPSEAEIKLIQQVDAETSLCAAEMLSFSERLLSSKDINTNPVEYIVSKQSRLIHLLNTLTEKQSSHRSFLLLASENNVKNILHRTFIYGLMIGFVTFVFSLLIVRTLHKNLEHTKAAKNKLKETNTHLKQSVRIDYLTGLPNRLSLTEYLNHSIKSEERTKPGLYYLSI